MQYEKLTDYAKRMGVQYQTAWNWFKQGKIEGAIKRHGSIFVPKDDDVLDDDEDKQEVAVVYARVSSSQNKDNLETQAERVRVYSMSRGYKVHKVVKETGSGLNDERKKLETIFKDPNWSVLVVEHKDRLTRFGFRYLEMLSEFQNRRIEIINRQENNDNEDIIEDLVSIITSFCARIYGRRRSQRKTEKIIEGIKEEFED